MKHTKGMQRLAEAAPELLEAAKRAYAFLADVTNQWLERHTTNGQRLLIMLRDSIASATGESEEFVQDWGSNSSVRDRETGPPELLDAAQQALNALRSPQSYETERHVAGLLEAAIKKAEGEK